MGAKGSTREGSQSYSVKESEFCSNSFRDNTQFSSDINSEVVVDVAIRAWEKCIESTNASGSWLEYEMDPEGNFWTGFIRTRINNDSLKRTITSISIVPPAAKEEVKCEFDGDPLPWGKLSVDVKTAKTAISCSRTNSQKSSAITLDLNTTSIGPVHWPSKAAKAATDVEVLSLQVQELEAQQAKLTSSVSKLESTLEIYEAANEELKKVFESGSPKLCIYEQVGKITYAIPVASNASIATCRELASQLSYFESPKFTFHKACFVDDKIVRTPLASGMTDYPSCKW